MEKISNLKLGFGSEYNNQYLVVVNGSKVVKADANKKPCLRRCISISKKLDSLVELFYQYSDGSVYCLDWWN